MRISDWSSDVCSSDLEANEAARTRGPHDRVARGHEHHAAAGHRNGVGAGVDLEGHISIGHDQRVFVGLADAREAPPFQRLHIMENEVLPSQLTRTEKGRVGKEWVRTVRSWWARFN